MPKGKGYKPFSELSKKEKMSRASAARRKAESVLSGPMKSSNRAERAKAERAEKAARRVEERLSGKRGPGPDRSAATKPSKSKKSKTGATRSAVDALFQMGKFMVKAASGKLASQEAKQLKKVKKKTE